MSLSQIELVWVSIRVEWECFWVNLREDNKVSESKMAVSEFNMAEFKMAAIMKLSQNKWVKFFLSKWWERILASVSEFERKYYDGWIQDGCQYQFRWEWLSLSQIELVWVSIRMEGECLWVNLREDNKVSESKMAVSESNMAQFKIDAIIKLSQNEWVIFFVQNGWILDGRIQDGCHHQIESEWMREFFLCKWWESILASVSEFERKTKMAESKMIYLNMADFKMVVFTKLGENEWVWVRLN